MLLERLLNGASDICVVLVREQLTYTSSSMMDVLLLVKTIPLVTLSVATKMTFIPPNQPGTTRGPKIFGSADPPRTVVLPSCGGELLIAYLLP